MTLKQKIECDAWDCNRVLIIDEDDSPEYAVSRKDWHDDPVTYGQHYCNKCWPVVKEELKEDGVWDEGIDEDE